MKINYIDLFDQHGVDYRLHGQHKSVHRNNVGVCCPFCGDDGGFHLGINLETGMWNCWHSEAHRGTKPDRLLVALLKISWAEAKALYTDQHALIGFDTLRSKVDGLWKTPERRADEIKPIKLLKEFRRVSQKGYERFFWKYLKMRGLPPEDIQRFCNTYRLRCALTGRYGGRLVIPFRYRDEVVGWTARVVGNPKIASRYDTFPENNAPKQIVFNYDRAAEGGRVLAIVEGPMDAMAVDFYGTPLGIHGVGLMSTTATTKQRDLLLGLSDRFDATWIMLDAGLKEARASWVLQSKMVGAGAMVKRLPPGVKDPWLLLENRRMVPFLKTNLENSVRN